MIDFRFLQIQISDLRFGAKPPATADPATGVVPKSKIDISTARIRSSFLFGKVPARARVQLSLAKASRGLFNLGCVNAANATASGQLCRGGIAQWEPGKPEFSSR
jgi:hypothetical protein